MRFKSVGDFNKALLGKQGWRLLHGEHTLLGNIFKARYFPKCKFMDAPLGFSTSYVQKYS